MQKVNAMHSLDDTSNLAIGIMSTPILEQNTFNQVALSLNKYIILTKKSYSFSVSQSINQSHLPVLIIQFQFCVIVFQQDNKDYPDPMFFIKDSSRKIPCLICHWKKKYLKGHDTCFLFSRFICVFSSIESYLSFLHRKVRRARTARPTIPNTQPRTITCLISEKQTPTTGRRWYISYLFKCSHVTIFKIVLIVLILLVFVEQTGKE